MKFIFESRQPKDMRYSTVGDWLYDDVTDTLTVIVAASGTDDYDFLVMLHELVEAYLCTRAGVTTEVVDEWDTVLCHDDEPGDHPECPYGEYHRIASEIERKICGELSWIAYERVLDNLDIPSS